MKRTLILPVLLTTLAILAFATAADAEPCMAQNMDVKSAEGTVASKKEDLRIANKTQRVHVVADHAIAQSSGPTCHTCTMNIYAMNQARAAVAEAERALSAAEGAYKPLVVVIRVRRRHRWFR